MGWKRVLLVGLAAAVVFAAGPAFSQCKLGKVAELPVTMHGGSPLVSAAINGFPVTLLADSGGFFSNLTPGAASRIGLRGGPLPGGMTVSGATGEAQMTYATVRDFTAPGMIYKGGVDFLIGASGLEPTSDGLLGANFLSQMDTEYDFAHGIIRLMHPENCGKADLAYWAKNVPVGIVAIDPIGAPSNWIQGSVTINGVNIRVLFDTGASRSVLTLAGAKRAGVTPQDVGVTFEGKEGGVGRTVVNGWIAPFKSFEVGGEEIKNTKLHIADLTLQEGVEMLLGADFFLSHHVYVAKSQNKLYFTYNGGAVFNLTGAQQQLAGASGAAAAPEPGDAAGYVRQAAALLSRGDVKGAMVNYNKAVELMPSDPNLLYERGLAESETGQMDLALADYDKALSVKPAYTAVLLARGEARLGRKNLEGARQDFNQAIKTDGGLRLSVAEVYAQHDQFTDALDLYGQVISKPDRRGVTDAPTGSYVGSRPDDPHLGDALAGRCHVRALSGQDLKDALDDCNKGVRLSPGATEVVVDRGYVQLRLGQVDRALSDFALALHDQPKYAWALYGRGVAEVRKGDKAAGEADIKAAAALQEAVVRRGETYGLTP